MTARRTNQPISRETRLASELIEAAERSQSSREGDQLIILVHSQDGSGIGVAGYDDEADAIGDLLVDAQQIAEAHGGRLNITGSPN